MHKILSIIFICVYGISCKKEANIQKVSQNNKTVEIEEKKISDTLQIEVTRTKPNENIFSGKFFTKNKVEALSFEIYSAKDNKYLDSIPRSILDNSEKKNEYIFNNNIELHIKGKSNNPLKFENASSLFFIQNIGDNNNDGLDEIALVVNYADESNLNSCKIYQYHNYEWQELHSFSVNEMSFYFENEKENTKYKNSIKDHLEKRNSNWYYSDYMESMDSEDGKSIFKKLRLKKCK